jgi:hypothetical protein
VEDLQPPGHLGHEFPRASGCSHTARKTARPGEAVIAPVGLTRLQMCWAVTEAVVQPANTAVAALGMTALGQSRRGLGHPRRNQASPGSGEPGCLARDGQRSLGLAMFASRQGLPG